jgi:hypothetical protein
MRLCADEGRGQTMATEIKRVHARSGVESVVIWSLGQVFLVWLHTVVFLASTLHARGLRTSCRIGRHHISLLQSNQPENLQTSRHSPPPPPPNPLLLFVKQTSGVET